MSSLSAVEAKLEAESKAFQALQKGRKTIFLFEKVRSHYCLELEKLVETRQRLEAQQQENEIVNTVCIKDSSHEFSLMK